MKYGSRSCSERFCELGGKRPKIWMPGVVCAADDGFETVGGDGGPSPPPIPKLAVLSLADDEGTGRY